LAEKKTRVHNLAKDLSVPSKVIIEKCRAEGIDIKNHMHVLSAGLEATIREWFSEGAHNTTLEESKRIDLKKVRVKRKARKKAAAAESSEGGVAVLEKEEEKPARPAAREKETRPPAETEPAEKPREAAAADDRAAPTEAPAEPPAGSPDAPPAAAEAAPTESPKEAPAEPARPAAEATPTDEEAKRPVAGPQNIPRPAALSGPKVVRIEAPDRVEAPRPARPRPAAGRPGLMSPTDDRFDVTRQAPSRGKEADRDEAAKKSAAKRGLRDERDLAKEKLREWKERDLIERRDRLAHASGRGIGGLRAVEGQVTRRGPKRPRQLVKKDKIELAEPITIKDLSRESGLPVAEIQKILMADGVFAGINTVLDSVKAQLICAEQGIELTVIEAKTGLEQVAERFAALERQHMKPRPPVVTVLGHVDHGKTSLLDRIRSTAVASGEAGGITQHVGASWVAVGDKSVTFIDTPGHAAFTAMRARGANLTDVVVLVVAADDGVMPTTVEAINHAKAAECTIVVALNKIDLPHEIDKIYGQLAEQGLTPSEWGGDTDVIKTSAVTGAGVEDLLEHLATLSEILELQADPSLPASGTVVESEVTGARGVVARFLVQEGTLKTGDILVCGPAHGRVRSMKDPSGKVVREAGPSMPVEVLGLDAPPEAGDKFYVLDNMKQTKEIAEEVAAKRREKELAVVAKPKSLEEMLAGAEEGSVPELRVLLRADVQGSVDVLRQTLTDMPDEQVRLSILHAGVGTVIESDVTLAQASDAIIIAFNVAAEPAIERMADNLGVDIRTYRVIYNLMDDIKKALEGLLEPDQKMESRGRAEVREIFNVSRVGTVAGCYVRDGVIHRSHKARLLRDGTIIRDQLAIDSLKRFKDDAKEVKAGFECGIHLAGFDDVKPGDVIEAFEVVEIARKLQN